MTRRRKFLIITGSCFAVYTIGIYFVLSMVLTHVLPEKLTAQLGRQITIEQIRVNPLTLSVTIRGFEIKDKNKTNSFARFKSLYVNAEILSLIKKGLILKAVQLEKPQINIARLSGTTFNFSDIIANLKSDDAVKQDEQAKPSQPFNFAVAGINIIDGAIVYKDLLSKEVHTIEPINWKVPFISNFSKHHDQFSEPALTFKVDEASVSVDVQTKIFKNTMETVINLVLSGVSIPRYTSYIPKDLINFEINQGILDITAQVSFRKEKDTTVVTAEGKIDLANLDITETTGSEIFTLPRLQISLLPSVVTENSLHFSDILVRAPTLSAIRKADGTVNLANLITASRKPAPESKNNKQEDAAKQNSDTGKPFSINVDRFLLTNGTARLTDFATTSPDPVKTSINDLNITVAPFSTTPANKSQYNFSATINNTAPFSLNGDMTLVPLSVESDITLSDVALAWCQPYLPENIKLVITGGEAATSGHLSLSKSEDDKISATVSGNLAFKKFASVDPEKAKSFLKWDNFTIDGVNVSAWPLRISTEKIAFTGLKNQIVVFEDGVSSTKKIFVKKQETVPTPVVAETSTKKSAVIPIQIGKFLMSNSAFRFADQSIKPNYSTQLTLKDLSVVGLTSENFKAATVSANGAIDGYAPVSISGTINPLAKDLFVDLDVKLANIEMVPFSTYTGKYVGRAIEKGKLNIDVQYHIKDKAIAADNHVLIDQFTLGKTVESPDAINLPVGLAVSLLQDRKGMITIDLPISGRTDDPDFAWGKVVLKALGNLIMKAATSPFALVGSLVGGGEELRFIEFEPGTAEIDEAGNTKLKAIQTVLVERPALKMEIVGYADIDTDRQALGKLALDRKIKAPELLKASKNNTAPDNKILSAILLTPEQRKDSLRQLYTKEVIKKPVEGQSAKQLSNPTLSIEEMEVALLKRIVINEDDLQFLAMKRAANVKENLLQGLTISAERVFLKKPDSPFKTDKDNYKPSRVELGVN